MPGIALGQSSCGEKIPSLNIFDQMWLVLVVWKKTVYIENTQHERFVDVHCNSEVARATAKERGLSH